MQPLQRGAPCACRAAAVRPGFARSHEQRCWGKLLGSTAQHGTVCGVQCMWSGRVQPLQRSAPCACRAAAVRPGFARSHEQRCWGKLLGSAAQHGTVMYAACSARGAGGCSHCRGARRARVALQRCAPGSHAATSRDVGANSWVPPHSTAQLCMRRAVHAEREGGSSREPDGRGQMRCGRGRPVPHLCGAMMTRFGAHREAIMTMFRQASSFDPTVPSCGLVCRQVTFAHITFTCACPCTCTRPWSSVLLCTIFAHLRTPTVKKKLQ